MKVSDNKMVKIPVLTQDELNEYCRIMSLKDESLETEFWEQTYSKNGLVYDLEKKLVNKFNELVESGKMHLNLVEGSSLSDLTDEDKISIMNILNKHKARG